MPDGMGWLLRPVHAGMCRYESLLDCTITLEDVLLMNTSLDFQLHNAELARKIQNGKRT